VLLFGPWDTCWWLFHTACVSRPRAGSRAGSLASPFFFSFSWRAGSSEIRAGGGFPRPGVLFGRLCAGAMGPVGVLVLVHHLSALFYFGYCFYPVDGGTLAYTYLLVPTLSFFFFFLFLFFLFQVDGGARGRVQFVRRARRGDR
jgi:hypothetical protein